MSDAASHMCPQKGSRGRWTDAGALAVFLFFCSLGLYGTLAGGQDLLTFRGDLSISTGEL